MIPTVSFKIPLRIPVICIIIPLLYRFRDLCTRDGGHDDQPQGSMDGEERTRQEAALRPVPEGNVARR